MTCHNRCAQTLLARACARGRWAGGLRASAGARPPSRTPCASGSPPAPPQVLPPRPEVVPVQAAARQMLERGEGGLARVRGETRSTHPALAPRPALPPCQLRTVVRDARILRRSVHFCTADRGPRTANWWSSGSTCRLHVSDQFVCLSPYGHVCVLHGSIRSAVAHPNHPLARPITRGESVELSRSVERVGGGETANMHSLVV